MKFAKLSPRPSIPAIWYNTISDTAPHFLTFCSNGQSLLLFKFNIFVINTIVVASNNQMPAAENKANIATRHQSTKNSENHHKHNNYMHDNSSMLTLCLLFYAQAMV